MYVSNYNEKGVFKQKIGINILIKEKPLIKIS